VLAADVGTVPAPRRVDDVEQIPDPVEPRPAVDVVQLEIGGQVADPDPEQGRPRVSQLSMVMSSASRTGW